MNELTVTEADVSTMQEIFADDKLRSKRGIQEFSDYIESLPDALGEDPFPLFHEFGGGVYTREIHLPKGYVLVGKLHNHEAMVYMLKGKVLVADEDGVRMVEAPCQFVSKAGVKRVGLVIEDVVWIDIHQTDKTTIEEAEAELFRSRYNDFELLCDDLGYSVEEVRKISENVLDLIDDKNDDIYVKESEIEGKGAFANIRFNSDETIGISRIGLKRTELGRYANHSFRPNAKCEIKNNSLYFVAIKHISVDDEITVDYKQVRKQALELDNMLEMQTGSGWLSCQA